MPTHLHAAHQSSAYLYESLHTRTDGTGFLCSTHVTALQDTHGKIQLRAAIFENITNHRQTEETLYSLIFTCLGE